MAQAAIDEPRFTAWFAGMVDGVVPPLDFTPITGGRSNLTYLVEDVAGNRWILRRPPMGDLLPRAHDMGREHQVLRALETTPVPVPRTLGHCADATVTGAEFYVMEYVPGTVVADEQIAATLPDASRQQLGIAVADTLAAIHAVDPVTAGLDGLGRPTGYLERQLHRWRSQLEQSRTRELPDLERVHAALVRHLPAASDLTIVHGDYRLDNCLVSDEGAINAVLDWELCTLGDPMADVGLLMVYWAEPEDGTMPPGGAPTSVPGYPTRQDVLRRYAQASGRDCSNLEYYVALGYWKLACITEGVHRRYLDGSMGEHGQAPEGLAESVLELGSAAEAITRRWS